MLKINSLKWVVSPGRLLLIGFPILLSMLVVGCSKEIVREKPVDKLVYVTNPLPLPARPTLPTWTGKDMQCLPDGMKQKIRDRDRLLKDYAEDLESIIKSTHSK